MIKTEKPLVQWDLNRVVEITTDETFNEVHFYNNNCQKALVVKPFDNNTKANIPNILLQEELPIVVWIVYSDESGDRSLDCDTLVISPRKMPDDYVYEETEVITFKKLVKDVEEAVKRANAISADMEESFLDDGEIKGFYYKAVDTVNKIIYLSSEQHNPSLKGYSELTAEEWMNYYDAFGEPLYKNMTYKKYNALSENGQKAFYESFASTADFFAWYNWAHQVYEYLNFPYMGDGGTMVPNIKPVTLLPPDFVVNHILYTHPEKWIRLATAKPNYGYYAKYDKCVVKIVKTFATTEGTFVHEGHPDVVMQDCGNGGYSDAYTKFIYLGRCSIKISSADATDGNKYILLKVDISNVGALDWDYARLNLMSQRVESTYQKHTQVTASLVGDYTASTVTWNNQPTAIWGAPISTFAIDTTAGVTSGCDVTDLIKYAVEQGMTSVNILLKNDTYFGVRFYGPGSDLAESYIPTLQLLKEAAVEDLYYSEDAVGRLLSVKNEKVYDNSLTIAKVEAGKVYYELVDAEEDPFEAINEMQEVDVTDFALWCNDCRDEGIVHLRDAITSLVLESTSVGSKKRFRITVDDSGKLSATEIV